MQQAHSEAMRLLLRSGAAAAPPRLLACSLPTCGAKEAHPRDFKRCGRCRAAAYCGAAHAAEDWRRHKREDKCTQVHDGMCSCQACVPGPKGPFKAR
jgi:hypothetical protein